MSLEAPAETAWLVELVRRAREEGLYRPEQIDDFYVGVLFSIQADLTKLPASLRALLIGFMQRAAVPVGATPEETHAAISKYFEANPIPDELATRFRLHMRELMSRPEYEGDIRRFERFLDDAPELADPKKPPPPGAVGGGPLAFFRAREKLKKKK